MSQAEENEFDEGIEIAPGVWYGGTKQLAKEKIEARMRLLAMPPEEAQKLVEQTLYPNGTKISASSTAAPPEIAVFTGASVVGVIPNVVCA